MPSDFRSLFRRNDITLLETRQEADDRQVFFFAFKPGLTWKAGQHALFAFRGERLAGRNFRPFSVASTPAENVIAIITTIGSSPSPFKSRLQAMRVGEDISLRGPFGGF